MFRAFRTVAPAFLVATALRAQDIRPTFTRVGEAQPVPLSEAVGTPNGRYVLAAFSDSAGDRSLLRFDRTTGRWSRHPAIGAGNGLTISPDGRFLAYARQADGQDGLLHVWVTPLDSSTSLPAGPTRRVSAQPGAAPEFSPDGRTLAFRWSDSATSRIVTVPFTGGEERVIIERPGRLGPPHWSPDGRFLYTANLRPTQPTVVLRIPVAGGKAEPVINLPASGGDALPVAKGFLGLSADGQRMLVAPTRNGQAIVFDVGGHELGRFTLPPDLEVTHWSRADPSRILAVERRAPTIIHTVAVADGATRSIGTSRQSAQSPTWSPDSKQLAFAALTGDRYQVVISSPDGSGQRVIPTSAAADGPIAWSPDGRYIAFASRTPAALSLIDVRTGREKLWHAIDSTARWSGTFLWRDDSRGIVYLRESSIQATPGGDGQVRRLSIDGRDDLIRVLPDARFPPSERRVFFISDTLLAVVRSDSVVGIPLPSGPRRTLYHGTVLFGWIEVSPDHRWFGIAAPDPGKSGGRIPRIISVATGATRAPPPDPTLLVEVVHFHPDGKHLIVFGHAPDAELRIALVSLTGEPVRILTAGKQVQLQFNGFSLSPDGRTIVYAAYDAVASQLYHVDLPPVPASAAPRQGRPKP